MKKKVLILLLLGFSVFLFSCKGPQDPGEILPETGDGIGESYEKLKAAQAAFLALDAGVLEAAGEFIQTYIEAGNGQENEYRDQTADTIHFRKTSKGYDYIQISQTVTRDTPEGYKQEDGVRTLYQYMAYPDGTFEWKESAAEKDYYDLPAAAALFTALDSENMIRDILVRTEGSSTVYELVPDEAYYDSRASQSTYTGYSLDAYTISYHVDSDGLLRRVVLSETESWIHTEIYNIKQSNSIDIELVSLKDEADMDHFPSSSTYQRPVYDEITEIWRQEFINIPETYLFDVRIPKLRKDLPNADAINERIAADCSMELNATPEDLESQGEWGGYPWHTTDFAVYRFGDIYEICIFNTEASAWGSGVSMWLYKYYYDAVRGQVVEIDDFLASMQYTPEEIVEAFYRDYLYESPDSGGDFTYDQIRDWFYLDGEGRVQFYVNLYG